MNNVFNIEQLVNQRLLRVPDYQRGYAWEERQLAEFIEDVELLPVGKYHYTGTVVLFEPKAAGPAVLDEDGKQYTTCHVVDGQQRLTTVVLLLNAIRRELAAFDALAGLARGIYKGYVAATDLAGQPLYRLELNSDCRDYFAHSVLADTPAAAPAIRSHERLRQARDFFASYLADQRKRRDGDFARWLVELRNKVVHQLRVTLYTVEEEAEVGVIFEVLNDRGKPLSELEKVKNYLLYLASRLETPGELPVAVNRTWARVFARLMQAGLTEAADEDQFLRLHWQLAHDADARNWEGCKSVKRHFDLKGYQGRHPALLGELLDYVRGLDRASLPFCEARRPRADGAFALLAGPPGVRDRVARFSEKLLRVRVLAPFLPLLVAARLRWPEDGAKYLELVKLCEVFAFRVYRFMGSRSNAGSAALLRLGADVFRGAAGYEDALLRLRARLLRHCPTAEFEAAFALPERESEWYGWSGLKYFLYEYEEHLAGNDVVQLPWDAVERRDLAETVEHVLPQTPTDPYWTSRFTAAQRRRLTHDVGNLSLTTHNSSYGNKPFPDKRGRPGAGQPCYANSNLYQERALAAFVDWDEQALLARRGDIVAWALRRWHVEEVEPDETDALAGPDESEEA